MLGFVGHSWDTLAIEADLRSFRREGVVEHLSERQRDPVEVECADDQEAIGKAAQLTNGKSVELWEGARFIVRFPSDEG